MLREVHLIRRARSHSPRLKATAERSKLNEVGSGGNFDDRILDDESVLSKSRLAKEGSVLHASQGQYRLEEVASGEKEQRRDGRAPRSSTYDLFASRAFSASLATDRGVSDTTKVAC